MFSSFSSKLSGSKPESSSKNTKFFKRKRKNSGSNEFLEEEKVDSNLEEEKHRILNENNENNENENSVVSDENIENVNDVGADNDNGIKKCSKTNEQSKCKNVKKRLSDKFIIKNNHIINRSKDKSKDKANRLNKLTKWFHNKFEHSNSSLNQLNKEKIKQQSLSSNRPATSDSDLNSEEDLISINESTNKENESIDSSIENLNDENDRQVKDKLKQQFNRTTQAYSSLKRDNLLNKEDESSSSNDECNCCRDKVKKLKLERLKLKNQLKRRTNWKKFFVFLNPIVLLAIFFYLLYCEITAVRAEELTSPTSNLLLNNSYTSKLEQLINLNNLNKNVNSNVDNNRTGEKVQEESSSEFYTSPTFNKPIRIPISKRNFFSNFQNNKQNQQFDDGSLLNNLPPFKILAILPTALSPQLSRHLHRAMELYYAYTEGLVSYVELANYFEHLRFPNGAQTDLSSSLHHLQINASFLDHHKEKHNEKLKFLLHSNHSELNYEDHLYTHLIQRIHHRNRTLHHAADQSNSLLYTEYQPNLKHHLNEKQLNEQFVQENLRKRLKSNIYLNSQLNTNYQNAQYSQSAQSTQYSQFTQQPEMQLSLLPLGNSSQRLINSLCDALEIQRPSLILSLVDVTRNYYLEMLARISDIPMLTLTGEYQETASFQKLLIEVRVYFFNFIFAYCVCVLVN